MLNFPIRISVRRRNDSGEPVFKTCYEGSGNASDVTEDALGKTATIAGTPEDTAGGSIIVCVENGKVYFFDEENENWRKQFSFQG